jgi:hypothetical protein
LPFGPTIAAQRAFDGACRIAAGRIDVMVRRHDAAGEDGTVKFMLMMHAPMGTGDWDVMRWKPEDIKAMVDYMHAINTDLQARGELVSAEGLTPPAETRIVRAGKNGAPVVTDGPFAETKEFLAGFWIVETPTAERAYEIAARASAAPGSGGVPMNVPIEVRAVGSAPA